MNRYKALIELEFDSEFNTDELKELIQVCLVDENEEIIDNIVTLDKTGSSEFSINDYQKLEIIKVCPECGNITQFRMKEVELGTLREVEQCSSNPNHFLDFY